MKPVPHSRPLVGRDEIAAVTRVLRSGQLSMAGEVAALEKAAAAVMGVRAAAAVSSGTAALHLALAGLGVGPGDEVILPTFVCPAVLNAVHYTGAAPVLADIGPDSGNIDPKDAARRVTQKTRAMIVPHLWGMPADMKALLRLGIPLVEDAAQAAGAAVGKKPVGSLGRAGIVSFYATKMMGCGEGGMLLSSDRELMARARDLLSYDHRQDYRVRFNYKMSDIAAAMARVQLRRLGKMVARRRQIAAMYTRALAGTLARPLAGLQGTTPAFYRYVVRVPDAASAVAALKKKGVNAERPLFRPLHYYLGLTGYPAADLLFREAVSLPVSPALTTAEIRRVIHAARAVMSRPAQSGRGGR